MTLKEILLNTKERANERYDNFAIEEIRTISRVSDEAYLEKPTWLGGDEEFVCLFIDLDRSSKMSFKHQSQTMAKIYDYFTQGAIDIVTSEPFNAEYIDVKGDGIFGIFEGDHAVGRALACAITFKTFFEKSVRPKFQRQTQVMNCKIGIDIDKILVKKIGKRGDYNEVWAGRVVNSAAKHAQLTKEIYESDTKISDDKTSLIVISDKIHEYLKSDQKHAIMSCGHSDSGEPSIPTQVWQSIDTSGSYNIRENVAWYTPSKWCDACGEEFMNEIIYNL